MQKIIKIFLIFLQIFLLLISNLSIVFAQSPSPISTNIPDTPIPKLSPPESPTSTLKPEDFQTPGPFTEPSLTTSPTPPPPSPTENPFRFETPSPRLLPSLSPTATAGISANIRLKPKIRLEKTNFNSNESVSIPIENANLPNIKIELINPRGEKIEKSIIRKYSDALTTLLLPNINDFRPGKYTLIITDKNGEKTTQDFTWGVLAINPDKSIYLPGEKSRIYMAVLDDKGEMVCNAAVNLSVTDPEGNKTYLSIDNGKIKVNASCAVKELNIDSDYETAYQPSLPGKYSLYLTATTKNGTFTTSDFFEVRTSVPFDIKRTTATRIYPIKNYPVTFDIIANENFNGTIEESVPQSFTVFQMKDRQPFVKTEIATQPDDPDLTPINLIKPFSQDFPETLAFGVWPDDSYLVAQYKTYGLSGHDGLDFALPKGTPVIAADSGTVILAGSGAYGITIVIEHYWGRSYYGHLSELKTEVGKIVSQGQEIGLSGNTGLSTGPHLHFGIKLNSPDMANGYFGKTDPSPYLSGSTSTSHYAYKKIIWNLDVKKGDKINLGYIYDPPDNSPEFYLLGPLKFLKAGDIETSKSYFEELRPWQVASDTSGDIAHDTTVTGNNGAGATTVASSALTTGGTNRLLIATVATSFSNSTVSSISGASLTWEKISAGAGGVTAVETWRAFATSTISSQTITATISQSDRAIIVVSAYSGTNSAGTNGSGAIGIYSNATGSSTSPSLAITTTSNNSLVISSLNANAASSISNGTSQTINGQDSADTNMRGAQERQNSLTVNKGTSVTSSYSLGSSTTWNLIAVEILSQGPGDIKANTTVTGNNGAGATTVASSSMTINGPNRLLIATISTDGVGATATTVSSISGASLTWVQINSQTNSSAGDFERVEMWRAFATSSFSSQTVTANLSQSDQATIVVTSYVGANPSGSNGSGAIGLTLIVASGSSSTPTSGSSGTKGKNSLIISGLVTDSNPTVTAGTDQTLTGTTAASTGVTGAQEVDNYLTYAAGTSAVNASYSLNSSQDWAIAVVEIYGYDPGIIVDAVTDGGTYTTGASLSFSHTVESNHGSRILVVMIGRRSGDASSTVTYNGTTMNLAVRKTNGTSEVAEIYYLQNPDTGAHNVVVTPSPTGPDFHAAAASYYFVDQSSGVVDITGGSNTTAGNVSDSVTTNADNDLLINTISHESTSAPTLPAGQTTIHLTDEGQWDTGASYKIVAGLAGSYAMGFNNGNSDTYAHAVAAFRPLQPIILSGYRFFNNDNSADVGSALAALNTNATAPAAGTIFRLRLLLHIPYYTLASSGETFKLQYAAVGTDSVCDVNFDGESYSDVSTTGDIKYDTTNSPADDATLTANGSDPTHGSDTVTAQTYNEANNFTNSVATITANRDGLWDFALVVDSGAPASSLYCFRVFSTTDSSILDSYVVIPEITTAAASGTPTTDQQMRHGNWFNNGVEQSFTF